MKNNKKVVLITGASSGIGNATAHRLLDAGHIVYGAARRLDRMKNINKKGGYSIPLDITKEDQRQLTVQRIIDEQGRIDVLINNEGYAVYGSVEDVSMDDVHRQFDVNLFSLARLTQLVLPHMRKAGSGTIINMSSMAGRMHTLFGSWYHATKFALEGWSDCLRMEVKPFGIDVVIIEPGFIQTEFNDVLGEPFQRRSMDGAYNEMAGRMIQRAEEEDFSGSSPTVIAALVLKAIKSKTPKTRYIGGKLGKFLIFTRNVMGDRSYDRFILKQFL